MWKEHAAEGERAIDDLGAQRKASADLERKDPNSPTARTYRSILVGISPEIAGQLEGATAEQMERMQPWLAQHARENADALKARENWRMKDEADKKRDAEKKTALDLAAKHYEQGQKNSDRNHEDSLGMQRAILGDKRATRVEEKGLKAANKLDDDTAALAKASGADVAMGRKALDEVEAAISAGGGEAPGTGRIKSMLPDALLSDEGNRVRQNALDALAIMLSVRSGATVSPDELKRSQGIYGINGSPEQFNEGMKRLRRDFESSLAAKQAGYGPDVKKKFAEQGGTLAAPGGAAQIGMVKMRFPNGQTDDVPAAEVEEAKKAGGVPL